jgi:small subunit ribosomal protein S6
VKRDYELGFILNPEVSEEQTGAILSRISQIVTNYDGQIVRVNQWGRRRMAYPIEHHRDGFYVFVDMILTPETVFELDRSLKVSEEVLRHMVIRRDPRSVQKEREEYEARAAQEQEQAARAEAAPDAEALAEGNEANESLTGDEGEQPGEISPDEIEDVPPAIEEETIEA